MTEGNADELRKLVTPRDEGIIIRDSLPIYPSPKQAAVAHFLRRAATRARCRTEDVYTDARVNMHPHIQHEVQTLQHEGYDVTIVDTPPRHELSTQVQAAVDEEIAQLSKLPNCTDILFEPSLHPAGATWFRLAKYALALQTLYAAGTTTTLADGLDPSVFHEPIIDGLSSMERLRSRRGDQEAQSALDKYVAYASTPMSDHTDAFPSSRDFLVGVIDSRAVQTRADTAINMAREHMSSRPGHSAKRGVVTASLTCGAANPLYEMARSLDQGGTPISTILLIDSDEMALATAASLARSKGVEDRVILYHRDLFRHRLTSYIKPGSVDVVDLLGLVDWVPSELRDRKTGLVRRRPIQRLLSDVGDIVRAGGMILVGNMLNKRPQQAFVERVWPSLFQRGVREMLSIIATAGFDPMTVQVRIPGREGVYAVYGIPIP